MGQQNDRSLRMTFSYQGAVVKLMKAERLEMRPPPSDPVRGFEGRAGFWYELRNANGETVYRHAPGNPIRFTIETVPDDPNESPLHVPVPNPQGTFTLIMPDLPEARALALVSSPLGPKAKPGPARDIAVFDLSLNVS